LHTSHRLRIIVMPRTVYHRDLPDLSGFCDTNTTVLDNSTITSGNVTIGHLSLSCPTTNCTTTKRAAIERRNPICSTGATCECYPNLSRDKKLLEQRALTGNVSTGTVNCTNLSPSPISPTDCQPIIQYLSGQGGKPQFSLLLFEHTSFASQPISFSLPGANFTIPPQTFDIYTVNTCSIGFLNLDCVNYTACFTDFVSAFRSTSVRHHYSS
jgi:hypothetical protein